MFGSRYTTIRMTLCRTLLSRWRWTICAISGPGPPMIAFAMTIHARTGSIARVAGRGSRRHAAWIRSNLQYNHAYVRRNYGYAKFQINGDYYQHLYSWWQILALKIPDEQVAKVIVEDASARSIDDVTIRYASDSALPDRFYQIKYHESNRKSYTAEQLITPEQSKESLLEKFWSTWLKLRQDNPNRTFELYLVSNWTWGNDL